MGKKNISGLNTHLTGVGNHFQDGVNWVLNKIKKKTQLDITHIVC